MYHSGFVSPQYGSTLFRLDITKSDPLNALWLWCRRLIRKTFMIVMPNVEPPCDDLHTRSCGRFKKTALIENNVNGVPVNTGTLK